MIMPIGHNFVSFVTLNRFCFCTLAHIFRNREIHIRESTYSGIQMGNSTSHTGKLKMRFLMFIIIKKDSLSVPKMTESTYVESRFQTVLKFGQVTSQPKDRRPRPIAVLGDDDDDDNNIVSDSKRSSIPKPHTKKPNAQRSRINDVMRSMTGKIPGTTRILPNGGAYSTTTIYDEDNGIKWMDSFDKAITVEKGDDDDDYSWLEERDSDLVVAASSTAIIQPLPSTKAPPTSVSYNWFDEPPPGESRVPIAVLPLPPELNMGDDPLSWMDESKESRQRKSAATAGDDDDDNNDGGDVSSATEARNKRKSNSKKRKPKKESDKSPSIKQRKPRQSKKKNDTSSSSIIVTKKEALTPKEKADAIAAKRLLTIANKATIKRERRANLKPPPTAFVPDHTRGPIYKLASKDSDGIITNTKIRSMADMIKEHPELTLFKPDVMSRGGGGGDDTDNNTIMSTHDATDKKAPIVAKRPRGRPVGSKSAIRSESKLPVDSSSSSSITITASMDNYSRNLMLAREFSDSVMTEAGLDRENPMGIPPTDLILRELVAKLSIPRYMVGTIDSKDGRPTPATTITELTHQEINEGMIKDVFDVRILGASYLQRISMEAGRFINNDGKMIDYPECKNGSSCVGMEAGLRLKSDTPTTSPVINKKLMAFMMPEIFETLETTGMLPPNFKGDNCVLCYYKYVFAVVMYRRGHESCVDTKSGEFVNPFQVIQGDEDGFSSECILDPLPKVTDPLKGCFPIFRYDKLYWEQVSGRYHVNQTMMHGVKPLDECRVGTSLRNFWSGVEGL